MDERDLSIAEAEQSYIDDLNTLEDWFLQYEYLLRISADLPRIPEDRRTEDKRVRGCQSGVWLELEYEDGRVWVRADSEALIIRGILSIAVDLLNGRTAEEIAEYRPRYIAGTNIKKQISTDRFNGLASVIDTVKAYAAERLRGTP